MCYLGEGQIADGGTTLLLQNHTVRLLQTQNLQMQCIRSIAEVFLPIDSWLHRWFQARLPGLRVSGGQQSMRRHWTISWALSMLIRMPQRCAGIQIAGHYSAATDIAFTGCFTGTGSQQSCACLQGICLFAHFNEGLGSLIMSQELPSVSTRAVYFTRRSDIPITPGNVQVSAFICVACNRKNLRRTCS